MKKRIIPFALLLAVFTSCSHEELPVQPAGTNPMPAPILSRSINATTATIVGYSATGALVFTHDLHQTDAENNVWEWVSTGSVPTHAQLENVQDLVCLIPAQTVSGKTITISPDADEQLMWDKMSVTEQHTDKRFYFDQVEHRLSKICVEVDRYYSSDRLYAYYHPGGTFDCLTGEFTKLNSRTATRIRPEKMPKVSIPLPSVWFRRHLNRATTCCATATNRATDTAITITKCRTPPSRCWPTACCTSTPRGIPTGVRAAM